MELEPFIFYDPLPVRQQQQPTHIDISMNIQSNKPSCVQLVGRLDSKLYPHHHRLLWPFVVFSHPSQLNLAERSSM